MFYLSYKPVGVIKIQPRQIFFLWQMLRVQSLGLYTLGRRQSDANIHCNKQFTFSLQSLFFIFLLHLKLAHGLADMSGSLVDSHDPCPPR